MAFPVSRSDLSPSDYSAIMELFRNVDPEGKRFHKFEVGKPFDEPQLIDLRVKSE